MVTSEAIGGDVLKPSQTINAAFIAQRGVIDFFAQCKVESCSCTCTSVEVHLFLSFCHFSAYPWEVTLSCQVSHLLPVRLHHATQGPHRMVKSDSGDTAPGPQLLQSISHLKV